MSLRGSVVAMAVAMVLVACGDDTGSVDDAAPATTTTIATVDGGVETDSYVSLEPGNHPVDAGPGSVVTMLLNEFPDQDPLVSLGFQPLPTQLELLPVIEGCPPTLPIARAERSAGRLSDDGQIFEALVGVGASMWPSPEAAQAALDFFETPAGDACEIEELELGYELSPQPGNPTFISVEPDPGEPAITGIDGLRSNRKVLTSEQFDTPFVQTVESSMLLRGSVIWVFTTLTLPDIDPPPALIGFGQRWLADRPAFDVPEPDAAADRAAQRLMSVLDEDVERPEWFEQVSQVELTTTRIDDDCSSYLAPPIASANAPRFVAISQVAASIVSENAATFPTAGAAAAEVDHYETAFLDCVLSETASLLSIGFTRNGESVERRSFDGIDVVLVNVDLIQTVGDQSFDVRIMTAIGAAENHVVHLAFEGLSGDEPELGELVAGRLELLAAAG